MSPMEYYQQREQWHRNVAEELAKIDAGWHVWDGPSPGMKDDGAAHSAPAYGEHSEVLVSLDEEYWGDVKYWIIAIETPEDVLKVTRREFHAKFTAKDVAEWAHSWYENNARVYTEEPGVV